MRQQNGDYLYEMTVEHPGNRVERVMAWAPDMFGARRATERMVGLGHTYEWRGSVAFVDHVPRF